MKEAFELRTPGRRSDGQFTGKVFISTPRTGPAYIQMQIQHRSRAPGPPYTAILDQPPGRSHGAELLTLVPLPCAHRGPRDHESRKTD